MKTLNTHEQNNISLDSKLKINLLIDISITNPPSSVRGKYVQDIIVIKH